MSDENPIAIRGLDHVVIRCNDINAMIAFYRDVLGCSVEREVEDLGLYQLRAGVSLIDLVDAAGKLGKMGGRPPNADGHNMDHFCVQVDPWDETAIIGHLEAHGIDADEVGIRYGALGKGPSIYIADPGGNTVELKGPPDS